MKQKIYEIPIWDAYALENCECPVCSIEKKAEDQFIETLFTEMVMDVNLNPQLTSAFRFCHEHFEKLYKYPDKCGLAILTDRILYLEIEALQQAKKGTAIKKSLKPAFLKKSSSNSTHTEKECLLCNKLSNDMRNYCDTIIKLWQKDSTFKSIFAHSRGFCLKHFNEILINNTASSDFKEKCISLQENNLQRLQEELQWFITKNDYRFVNESWKTSKDALLRTILKLIGNYNTKI
ncbi:MAG: hypothetical protein H7Y18_20060 [Clostridiaceae bacterium]|nr:hypothetical protein [Clostridiaceae bacterium]